MTPSDKHRAEETPADQTEARPRWGLGDAALGQVVAIVGAVVLQSIALGLAPGSKESLWLLAVGQVGLWFGLLGVPMRASLRKGQRSLARDFGFQARCCDAVWVVPGVVLQFALPLVYLPFRAWVHQDDIERPARELAERAGLGWGFVALTFSAVIGAPIVEELFYRGLVLRAAERARGPMVAIAVSGAWFGIAHFEPLQLPVLALFGAVSAWLAVRKGRLGPSIFLHAGFNGIAIVSLGFDLART